VTAVGEEPFTIDANRPLERKELSLGIEVVEVAELA